MSTTTQPRGTAVQDEETGDGAQGTDLHLARLTDAQRAEVEAANEMVREAYERLMTVFDEQMPVGRVQWLHIDKVQANDYNPNAVAGQEMRLLHTSISEDGYTQPVVAIWDETVGKAIIVDGYHRYTTMRRYRDIYDATGGYLPVVLIDKPIADRIASTVRHNRARGKHSVAGMSNLVFQMLDAGEDDATICNKLGLEAEELARLRHITGFSKLYADHTYTSPMTTQTQMEEKARYRRAHPDETVPSDY